MTSSTLGDQLVETGMATTQDLQDTAAAFRRWADCRDGWFSVVHGEAIARA